MTWYLVLSAWFLVGWGGMAVFIYFATMEEHIKLEDLVWCFGLGLLGPVFPILFLGALIYGVLKRTLKKVRWDTVVIKRKRATRKYMADKLMGVDDGST